MYVWYITVAPTMPGIIGVHKFQGLCDVIRNWNLNIMGNFYNLQSWSVSINYGYALVLKLYLGLSLVAEQFWCTLIHVSGQWCAPPERLQIPATFEVLHK